MGQAPQGTAELKPIKKSAQLLKNNTFIQNGDLILRLLEISLPIFKKVDICYILFDKYRTPRYRCDYQGCVTYVTGPKEYVGEFASPDMDCDDLPDVGQKF